MIECGICYEFKSPGGRIVIFERKARFAAVPSVGAQLSLRDDMLQVELVRFYEDGAPYIFAQIEHLEDAEIDGQIDEMKSRGWHLLSDKRA